MTDSTEWLLALVLILVATVLWLVGRDALRRLRTRRRFRRGAEGELEAARLLMDRGFVIEGVEVAGSYDLLVDGAPVAISVRADYVVRGPCGRRLVAEVKTGKVAPRIEHAATRRQLLEYRHAFAVPAVVLVDADTRQVRLIELPPEAKSRTWLLSIIAVVAAILMTLLLR